MAFTGSGILTRTVAPSESLFVLAEVKRHLRVDFDDDDAYIESLMSAVEAYLDGKNGVIGKALVTQSWSLSMTRPDGTVGLPLGPVQSITLIDYFDTGGVSQSLAVSDFYLYASEDRALLEPKAGTAWPAMEQRKDALSITYVAGFGGREAVPENIRAAGHLLIGHYYENREAVNVGNIVNELPLSVQNLLSVHRVGWVSA